MVAIPTTKDEDAKRPDRERQSLVGEQTRIVNRMKAALIRLGIRGFNPKLKKAAGRLELPLIFASSSSSEASSCRGAICFSAGQDRQLPDPGIADACARRSPGCAGVAAVSSRELDEGAGAVGTSGCSGRVSNGADEAIFSLQQGGGGC